MPRDDQVMNAGSFIVTAGWPPGRAARRRGATGGQDRSNRLAGGQPSDGHHLREAFLQGPRDLGYVEGHNLVIEYRDLPRGSSSVSPFSRPNWSRSRLMSSWPRHPAALAAKQATRTLPIVLIAVGDPVASRLVSSLARPGGNITGLSLLLRRSPETPGVCLWKADHQIEQGQDRRDPTRGDSIAEKRPIESVDIMRLSTAFYQAGFAFCKPNAE